MPGRDHRGPVTPTCCGSRGHTVCMTTHWAASRSLERIGDLCGSPLEDHDLRAALLAEIGGIVPFSSFVWPLTDPETCTGISPMARIPCPQELPALIRLKYVTTPGRWTALIDNGPPAVTLRTATGETLPGARSGTASSGGTGWWMSCPRCSRTDTAAGAGLICGGAQMTGYLRTSKRSTWRLWRPSSRLACGEAGQPG